ncbi:MAG: HNH endonuclease, partial [Hyphomicrobiaceae bacterium]|nr:HNH endonuclease [Hyphomicrobiaceae bacterium]
MRLCTATVCRGRNTPGHMQGPRLWPGVYRVTHNPSCPDRVMVRSTGGHGNGTHPFFRAFIVTGRRPHATCLIWEAPVHTAMEHEESLKRYMWENAISVDGFDDNIYRQDVCGAWIKWDMYGRITGHEPVTSLRWTKDHIRPLADGGSDYPSNLRALQWYNNQMKSDGYHKCHVTSDGKRNVLI